MQNHEEYDVDESEVIASASAESKNPISNMDSWDDIHSKKVKSFSLLKKKILLTLSLASFILGGSVLGIFLCHFNTLISVYEKTIEVYSQTSSDAVLYLYGWSIFSTVLFLISVVLGMLNLYSLKKKKKAKTATASGVTLKELLDLLNKIQSK